MLNISKKVVGFAIPYYKNSEQCEVAFKKLMEQLDKQITEDVLVYIYEDGQFSNWLWEYAQAKPEIIKVESNAKNKGVSYARNKMIDYFMDKVNYIAFIDSDDYIDDNYVKYVYEYCADNTHEIIEPTYYFQMKNKQFQLQSFDRNVVRSGIGGEIIQTKIIGDIRFDENLQVAEDTKFMNEVCDLKKYRKKHCQAKYYYQMGINPESLTMKYQRNEIKKERESK